LAVSKETILAAVDARIAEFDYREAAARPDFGTSLEPKKPSGSKGFPRNSAALEPLEPLEPPKRDIEVSTTTTDARAHAGTGAGARSSLLYGSKCSNGSKAAETLAKPLEPHPSSGSKVVPKPQNPSDSLPRAPRWNAREKVECLLCRGLHDLDEREAAFMHSLARQQHITPRQAEWLDRIVPHVEALSDGHRP
jgi:hypothetical protein